MENRMLQIGVGLVLWVAVIWAILYVPIPWFWADEPGVYRPLPLFWETQAPDQSYLLTWRRSGVVLLILLIGTQWLSRTILRRIPSSAT
jgi:hypothetical protein